MRPWLIAALAAWLAMGVGLILPGAARAGAPLVLRAEPVDNDGVVTLGDIFDGAGAAAALPVAERSGPSVVLDANALQVLTRRAGLDWSNPDRLRRIIVRQGAARAVPALTRTLEVQVLAYARDLAAGEDIRPEDLVWTRAASAPADALRDADQAIGMIARRPLREGGLAALRDVSAPLVIQAGDLVTATYQSGGVSLELQVKALGSGSLGQVVTLQNLSSRKSFPAVVTGPGRAATGPDVPTSAAPSVTRIARR